MLKSVVFVGLCSVSVLTAPAFAALSNPQFVTRQSTNEWRASKLVGVSVYGTNNKKIGSIEEVMLSPQGAAKVVVIGVGGFLGMGQKNVGVPFSSLQWKREAQGQMAARTSNGAKAAHPALAAARRGYPDRAILAATKSELAHAPNFKFASAMRSASAGPTAMPNTAAKNANPSPSTTAAPGANAPATGH